MRTFVIRRLVFLILAIIAATLFVFALSRLQGDPRNVMLNVGYVSPEQWEQWGKGPPPRQATHLSIFYMDGQRDISGRLRIFPEDRPAGDADGDRVRSGQPSTRPVGDALRLADRHPSRYVVSRETGDDMGRHRENVRYIPARRCRRSGWA